MFHGFMATSVTALIDSLSSVAMTTDNTGQSPLQQATDKQPHEMCSWTLRSSAVPLHTHFLSHYDDLAQKARILGSVVDTAFLFKYGRYFLHFCRRACHALRCYARIRVQ